MLWWTIQNLVIVALLAGLVRLACRLWRIGPVARHALWLVVLAKLLTPPLVAWPWAVRDPIGIAGGFRDSPATPRATKFAAPAPHKQHAPAAAPWDSEPMGIESGGAVVIVEPRAVSPSSAPSLARSTTPLPLLPSATLDRLIGWAGGAWLAGGAALAILQTVRIARMLRRLRRARPADEALTQRVHRLARRLKSPPVRVVVLPGLDSPFIWSLSRPVLVWPAEMPASMSAEAIDGLIVHELAHVKRRDHWVGWMELLAGCAWWWNPLFWYVRHQLRENAELACDAWVVDALPATGGRRAYAEALLAVCEGMSAVPRPRQAAPLPALGVGTGGRRFLERRLTMILRERASVRLPRLGLMIVGLVAAAALPAWSQKSPGAADSPGGTAVNPAGGGAAPAERWQQPTEKERVFGFLDAVGAATAPEARPLPGEAQELVRRYEREQAEARRQLEDRLTAQRAELANALRELQDRYAKEGRLDEALAIRERIRQMGQTSGAGGGGGGASGYRFGSFSRSLHVAGDPGNLTAYRDRVGQTFNFRVTGSSQGVVWGSGEYTDDSALATAAVHAGVLRDGEDGRVQVTILPGRDSYEGTTRNGVTTSSYGPWAGSYRVERLAPRLPRGGGAGAGAGDGATGAAPTDRGAAATGIVQRLRGHVGDVVFIELVGSTQGTVWGTDVYTDDSSLSAAAVHAGALRDGERGMVQITILPGQNAYPASSRNGVASQTWGPWDGSFRIERANVAGGGGDLIQNDPLLWREDGSGDGLHSYGELRGR